MASGIAVVHQEKEIRAMVEEVFQCLPEAKTRPVRPEGRDEDLEPLKRDAWIKA